MAAHADAGPRFDIVVFNHERLRYFLEQFPVRFTGFDAGRDRLTVVTCSPSDEERELVASFERAEAIPVRYLTRRNLGIDQLARLDYWTGHVGSVEENLSHPWIIQMQDHYLDPDAPGSRWDERLDFGVKGDVAPDGLKFDLDHLFGLAAEERLDAFLADRTNPCLVEFEGRRGIAPNGGNFAIRTDLLRAADLQREFQRISAECDGSYRWALFAEYMWAMLLLSEGRRIYDVTRQRLFTSFPTSEFHQAPDDYRWLFRFYRSGPARRNAMRIEELARSARSRLGSAVQGMHRG
jgi:hypothetical protein